MDLLEKGEKKTESRINSRLKKRQALEPTKNYYLFLVKLKDIIFSSVSP